jgi:ribosomal-protein-alanine N-acetyltransferase
MPIMPAAKRSTCPASGSVYLRRPRRADGPAFIAAVRASRALHANWVRAPRSAAGFANYLRRFAGARSRRASATQVGFLVCRAEDDAPVGVFNLSEIVRGSFRSAYLGYYGLAPHSGRGYMAEGLALVLRAAFRKLRLHRIEANVQPGNHRSVALVRAAGFTREGFSRRYVKIAGRWRDHQRWAILAEDWERGRRQGRRRARR